MTQRSDKKAFRLPANWLDLFEGLGAAPPPACDAGSFGGAK